MALKSAAPLAKTNSSGTGGFVSKDRTAVASDIFTFCTREKIDTWHVVVCHNARGIVERVLCKACKSEHRYKPESSSTQSSGNSNVTKRIANVPARGGATASSAAKTSASYDIWFEGIKRWGDKSIPTYQATQRFIEGDVLSHLQYGKGVVQKRRGNKIDVLFQDGPRTFISS